MISEVALSGRLGEVLSSSIRYVEIDRVVATPSGGRYEVDQVPVKTYGGKESCFMKAPKGSLIILKGRLETKEKIGLYVIAEMHEIFTSVSR